MGRNNTVSISARFIGAFTNSTYPDAANVVDMSQMYVSDTVVGGLAAGFYSNIGGTWVSDNGSEGTWVPKFSCAVPGDLAVLYTAQEGYFYKSGKFVHGYGKLSYTPTYTTASGVVRFTGFQYAIACINSLIIGAAQHNAPLVANTNVVSRSIGTNGESYIIVQGSSVVDGSGANLLIGAGITSGLAYNTAFEFSFNTNI